MAAVNKSGKVTAKQKGTATIRITVSGKNNKKKNDLDKNQGNRTESKSETKPTAKSAAKPTAESTTKPAAGSNEAISRLFFSY